MSFWKKLFGPTVAEIHTLAENQWQRNQFCQEVAESLRRHRGTLPSEYDQIRFIRLVKSGVLTEIRARLESEPWRGFSRDEAQNGWPDYNGNRPRGSLGGLHLAAGSGRKDVAELLLQWAYAAAAARNPDAAELARDYKAQVNAKDDWGWTPLHWAAERGRMSIAELLLANGAEVNVKDHKGRTPLHWAVQKGHKDVARLLRRIS
jgi:hypothetical protein